jgi:hypothetical protein
MKPEVDGADVQLPKPVEMMSSQQPMTSMKMDFSAGAVAAVAAAVA